MWAFAEPVALTLQILVYDTALRTETMGNHICDYLFIRSNARLVCGRLVWGAVSEGRVLLVPNGRPVSIFGGYIG